jgi:FkbH-like protein
MIKENSTHYIKIAIITQDNWNIVNKKTPFYLKIKIFSPLEWEHSLKSPNSSFDLVCFAEKIEAFLPVSFSNKSNLRPPSYFDFYLELIKKTEQMLRAPIFVCDFQITSPFPQTSTLIYHFTHQLNSLLSLHLLKLQQAALFPISQLIASFGSKNAWAKKYQFIANSPYSLEFIQFFFKELLTHYETLKNRCVKAIVLDLDNTLWRGEVGELGIEGLQLGGDYPGNVFLQIQKFFKSFYDEGIFLCLCSKNDYTTAINAIDNHPQMLLKKECFSAIKINWKDKFSNILEIAQTLNVNLDSLCFIDDCPLQRKLVTSNLPEVHVPNLPNDPVDWLEILSKDPFLRKFHSTHSDKLRNNNFKIQKAFTHSKIDKESLLKSLNPILTINSLNETSKARTLQLLQKTHQMNTSNKGENLIELDNISTIPFSYKDNDLLEEIAGVLIISTTPNSWHIHNFILSCRFFERGIEQAVFGWLTKKMSSLGYSLLTADLFPTQKNTPAQKLFASLGFQETSKNFWSLATPIRPPSYFEIIDKISLSSKSSSNQLKNVFSSNFSDLSPFEQASLNITEGWDSFSHIQLMMSIEKEFDITLSSENITELNSFNKIESFLENYDLAKA